ncbi:MULTISPECIES: CobW family GTP-binding protein [Coprococcus]|jgi:G3E family GTPase|uniref:CobW family GTP-binding protein n=1 Tax=Coprococcus TaxID=33042 RepID=UPI000E40FE80|nr:MULTISPECIES: CobW family GTP-binding protein [Coprococcus]NSE71492.1 GTP-binding protein [Coprococcus eutactus]RGD40797.1 cobalamin biosynthesis protein CobW [Coprococcus sp. AM14-16]RGI38737.1 cobalamin biosynthesis protein CobW [Coprococcus sp. OM06-34AC]RGI41643.1 cobalamin biosynthesis protein CobW [Coprococcus sp. OM06-25]RHU53651.1 cobalamin biosynthesis protein CobW [Coprococcus sp. TF11-13]
MTKIDIISGFLGAGKTTLIKKLIEQAFKGEKLVLIENEFGEIGIDGGFLKDAGVQITEMNSGCICCSLVGDFGTALKQVITDYTPDRIIIEPSGVGKLSDVIKAVKDVSGNLDVELDSYTTVADVSKVKIYMKNFGEFFNNQIESANTIILSRTQTTTQDKIEKAVAMIREKNDHATIITTPWDEIDGAAIREAMQNYKSLEETMMDEAKKGHDHDHDHGDECTCGCHDHDHHHDHDDDHEHHHDHDEHEHHHDHDDHDHHHDHDHGDECTCGCHDHDHHHHHADEVFTSWGKETPHKYNEDKLREILDTLADTEKYGVILRAKGIVPSDAGEWLYFDLVPGEFEIRKGKADITGKLCVIGSKLKEDDLAELFEV